VYLTETAMVSCSRKLLVRGISRVLSMCLLLLLCRRVFTIGSDVEGTASTSSQAVTYNKAAHMGLA
jgi:hypothetical protein